MAQQQPIIITAPQNNSAANTAVKYIVGGVLVGAALYFGKKEWDKYQHEKALREFANLPEAQQAVALYSAMNPSGAGWFSKADGTDEDAIFATAAQIKNLPKVQEVYKKVYGSNLIDDLQKELNADDLARFTSIVNAVKTGGNQIPTNNPTLAPSNAIISLTDVRVRKSPFVTGSFSKSNILTTTKNPNVFVGLTTGKTQRDNKNNVLFIEVKALEAVNGVVTGKLYSVWVASSAVKSEKLTIDQAKAKYGKMLTIEKAVYNLASSALSGLGFVKNTNVVTKAPCYTLTDQMHKIKPVEKGVLLGTKVSEIIDANGNGLIQFKTAQGNLRWVNKNAVNII